jgi:hypothetical protein
MLRRRPCVNGTAGRALDQRGSVRVDVLAFTVDATEVLEAAADGAGWAAAEARGLKT